MLQFIKRCHQHRHQHELWRKLACDLLKLLSKDHLLFFRSCHSAPSADRFPSQIKPWDLQPDSLSLESCFPTDYISLGFKQPGKLAHMQDNHCSADHWPVLRGRKAKHREGLNFTESSLHVRALWRSSVCNYLKSLFYSIQQK